MMVSDPPLAGCTVGASRIDNLQEPVMLATILPVVRENKEDEALRICRFSAGFLIPWRRSTRIARNFRFSRACA